jgi:hypothetical protein
MLIDNISFVAVFQFLFELSKELNSKSGVEDRKPLVIESHEENIWCKSVIKNCL